MKDAANGKFDCSNNKTVDDIAKQNVLDMMKQINEHSPTIHDQINNKQVLMVGAMHDLHSGKVVFFDDAGNEINHAS